MPKIPSNEQLKRAAQASQVYTSEKIADLATLTADTLKELEGKIPTDAERTKWNAKQNALTFDTIPIANSSNPVTSSGVKAALDKKANSSHGTHVSFSSTVPAMDGTASVGSSGSCARADHRHPTDTSRAAASDLTSHTGDTTVHITAAERAKWNASQNALTFDTTPTAGSSNPVTSGGVKSALDKKANSSHGTHVSFSSTAPAMDGTASAGSASSVARSDHRHPTDTSRAAASDLTTHIADAVKHITAAERTKWNAKQDKLIPRTIDGVAFDGSADNVHYAVCNTAADVKEKTVTIPSFSLVTGARIAVRFMNANTAANPELNVNDTVAKAITREAGHYIESNTPWLANSVVEFVYAGAVWHITGGGLVAESALKLHTARTLYVDLSSTTAASFDGTASVTPGVAGILGIPHGGTGANTAAAARENLGAAAASDLTAHTGDAVKHITTAERTKWNAKQDKLTFDTTPTAGSSNPVTSGGVKAELDKKANSSHGTHVSFSSTAPAMDGTASTGSSVNVARSDHRHPTDTSRAAASALTAHTGDTTKHITAAERTKWNAKQDKLTFDSTPTVGSSNPVTSSGIKGALDGKAGTTHTHDITSISVSNENLCLGKSAQAIENNSTALGSYAQANGNYSTALGYGAKANGDHSTALGDNAKAIGTYSTALGLDAEAPEDHSTALGCFAKATGSHSTALGGQAHATESNAIAIGISANAIADASIAIGSSAQAGASSTAENGTVTISGGASVAIGLRAQANGSASTALGGFAKANEDYSIALGYKVQANADFSTALGSYAEATGNLSIAIGYRVNAIAANSIAIGSNAQAEASSTAEDGTVTIRGNDSVVIGTNAQANGDDSTALGYKAQATGKYSIALGTYVEATGKYSIALGYYAQANGDDSTALGYEVQANGNASTALGFKAQANENRSTALGSLAKATGDYATALGCTPEAIGSHSIAIGSNAQAGTSSTAEDGTVTITGSYSIAIGTNAQATGGYSTALGCFTKANGLRSTAVGYGAQAHRDESIALGRSAEANGQYSTALGYCAVTSNANSIQLGSATSLSSITAKVGITVTSDERDKTNITPIADGVVNFLRKIKAIRYLWNGRTMYLPDESEQTDEDKDNLSKYGICRYDKEAHAKGTKKGSRMRVGVLAQEVQQALQDVYGDDSYGNLVNDNLYDFDPATIPEGIENQLGVSYENFIPFLIKAVQELDTRLCAIEKEPSYA